MKQACPVPFAFILQPLSFAPLSFAVLSDETFRFSSVAWVEG